MSKNTEICRIKLTRGKFALVDPIDFAWARNFRWHAQPAPNDLWYAIRTERLPDGSRRTVRLHVEIMKPPAGKIVDHRLGDGLDCRRSQMRICTRQQNTWNQKAKGKTSKYRGVSINKKQSKRFVARIRKDGRLTQIGSFSKAIEAARAYDIVATRMFGEFARLNFPVAEAN